MPKKKAAPADNTLWIGLAVGGAVVLIIIIAGAVGVYVYSQQNEQPKVAVKLDGPPPAIPQPQQQPKPKFKDVGDKPRPSGNTNLRARIDRIERINELRNIGSFYQQYVLNFNRPPATANDFTEYIKRDAPGMKQAIDEKYYFIVPNVRAGDAIVAYEFDPDTMGRHGTVRMGGQGAQEDMSSQELVAQLKAQGSQ